MLNKHEIIGHIGKEPVERYTPQGVCLLSFNVATEENDKQPDGTYKPVTEWHKVRFTGKAAEYAARKLKSGSLVYVEGSRRTNSWTDRGNQTHTEQYIKAERVKPLANLKEAYQPPQSQPKSYAEHTHPENANNGK